MAKVLTLKLQEDLSLESIKHEDIISIGLYSTANLVDIDNTLLDLLGGIESNLKGYSRSMQDSYSFSTKEIRENVEVDRIFDLFKDPNFFYELEPTKIANMINSRKRFKENMIIFTAEPTVECFVAKAKKLKEVLTNVGNITLFMYEGTYQGEKLASRQDVYNIVKKHPITLIDDNPKSIDFCVKKGKKIIIPRHKYTENHIKDLEFKRAIINRENITLLDI